MGGWINEQLERDDWLVVDQARISDFSTTAGRNAHLVLYLHVFLTWE